MHEEVAARLLDHVECTSDLIGVTDGSGHVLYLNDAALLRLGRTRDELGSMTTADVFPDSVFEQYFEDIRPSLLHSGVWAGVVPVRTAGGDATDVWLTVTGGTDPSGEVDWLVTSGRDIADWVQDRDLLSWQATHDELTGVGRRRILGERIADALARARRHGDLVSVLFIDLDDFKSVNDDFGHHAGDLVLAEIGRRLLAATREVDTVVRAGGDEFVVIVESIVDGDQAEQFAERLQAAVTSDPVKADGHEIEITASFGLAIGSGQVDPVDLLRAADAAMYEIKAVPGAAMSARLVTPSEPAVTNRARGIPVALTQQQIVPFFQPVVDLTGRQVVGYQVLARWGYEPSADFLHTIRSPALALAVDLAILRKSVAAAACWEGPVRRLYLHLFPESLADGAIIDGLGEALSGTGLDPDRVAVELPASVLCDARVVGSGVISAFRRLGVSLVASHVGRDPSRSLDEAYAHVDQLLLDAEVVRRLERDPDTAPACRALIAGAASTGMSVIATAVETDDQASHLAQLGCALATGYLFGRPEPS